MRMSWSKFFIFLQNVLAETLFRFQGLSLVRHMLIFCTVALDIFITNVELCFRS